MNDNYYINDLINSLKRDVVIKRYYPLIDFKKELMTILNKHKVVRKDEVSSFVLEDISKKLGDDVSKLFSRYIHIYDFNNSKLREIKEYFGTNEYDNLASLLRLPGVRLLRAMLYLNSGVTLEVLSKMSTEDIRSMVKDYIQKEKRSEIIPQPKEVNCHKEVAKMILNTN